MRIARLVLCAGVAACATAPDFIMAPPSPELGTVYVYRPANKNESGKSPDVYVGDEKLFALQNAGYAIVLLPPGEHQLVVRNLCFPAVQQKVAVRAGESTFLRFSVQDPLRPPPNESSGHWLADLFQLSDRTAELRKWSEEWCEQVPRFEAVETGAARSEIALTKLVDGASAEGIRPK